MKSFLSDWKKSSLVYYSLALANVAYAAPTAGIIGGEVAGPAPYGALISGSGALTPISEASLPAIGEIFGAAINNSEQGLIGGESFVGGSPIAYLVSPSGALTEVPTSGASFPAFGEIFTVAINNSEHGIIGGESFVGGAPPIAYLVAPSGALTELPASGASLPATGRIRSVAINNSEQGIIVGRNGSGGAPPIAYLVAPSGALTELPTSGSSLPPSGVLFSAAINDSGQGIIGGENLVNDNPIAYLVSPSGALTELPNLGVLSGISSVAINNSGQSIIGGGNTAAHVPIAYLVSPSGTLTELPTSGASLPTQHGIVLSVAINDFGQGIIGGEDHASNAFAYLVSPSGALTNLEAPSFTNAKIFSVAINEFGAGLIGGHDITTHAPIAYLVTPSGQLVALSPLPGNGFITTVAVNAYLLANVPTSGLTGNIRKVANYINQYTPELAYYFVPSVLDGTLVNALKSVAPMRNAFAVFTADNTFFQLASRLSHHGRDARNFRRHTSMSQNENKIARSSPQLDICVASNTNSIAWGKPRTRLKEKEAISEIPASPEVKQETPPEVVQATPPPKERPYEIWIDVLRLLSLPKGGAPSPCF